MKWTSPFSIILISVALSLIGIASLNRLCIQYEPIKKSSSISISYQWNRASAKALEKDVTSRIEGLASSIKGVRNIESVSSSGYGCVTLQVKNRSELESTKKELAVKIRQVFENLPKGVSYPVISTERGKRSQPVISYSINADLPASIIENYAKHELVERLSLLKDVSRVELSGNPGAINTITVNPDVIAPLGISYRDIAEALERGRDELKITDIPIRNIDGHIIRVGDICKIESGTQVVSSYFRVNGKNTLNLTIYASESTNVIKVCSQVRYLMDSLAESAPESIYFHKLFDSSEKISNEINKIICRTVLSLIILFIFVLITSQSWKYLCVIAISIFTTILVSLGIISFMGIEIDLYSMAGMTVSLGIMIDASIVMLAHYGYYRNRRVFLSILAAQLTTIGALSVIYVFPSERESVLNGFAAVLIINLAVSLAVSMFLIPALADTFSNHSEHCDSSFKKRRRICRVNSIYERYITRACKLRCVFIILAILVFGLPISLIPDMWGTSSNDPESFLTASMKEEGLFASKYNKAIGSLRFQRTIKPLLELTLGGLYNRFLTRNTDKDGQRTISHNIIIDASLPKGRPIEDLNDIISLMEKYLTDCNEIETFRTTINNRNYSNITVELKKQLQNTPQASELKQNIIKAAMGIGGVKWFISGVDRHDYGNSIARSYKTQMFEVYGYNYDNLLRYSTSSIKELSKNDKVSDPVILDGYSMDGEPSDGIQYSISYDKYALSAMGLTPVESYMALHSKLYSSKYRVASNLAIILRTSQTSSFGIWNLENENIKAGENMMRTSDIGRVSIWSADKDIFKKDQQYVMTVAYDYNGNAKTAFPVMKDEIRRLNDVLPIGYHAAFPELFGSMHKQRTLPIILVVVAIVFLICSILFESIRYSLLIVSLIPLSFIGVFAIFIPTEIEFGSGGLAALIMTGGLAVNSGIYLIQEYKYQLSRGRGYIRAWNHKVIPTSLTLLSTIMGLIPFLLDGHKDEFWYSFAIGAIGGLIMSFISLVMILPAFLKPERKEV